MKDTEFASLSQATVTVFTSHGAPLVKHLGRNGVTRAGIFYSGQADVVPYNSMEELAGLLGSIGQNQCIGLGVFRSGVTSTAVSTQNNYVEGTLTRTRADMVLPETEGLLFWDFDRKGMAPHVRARLETLGGGDLNAGALAAFYQIWPEAGYAGRVFTLSSSGGLHGYFRIRRAADLPEMLRRLGERVWLHGLGWIGLSSDGRDLVYGLVDTTVGGIERLIYEGQPTHDPDVPPPVRHPPTWTEGLALDLPEAPPPGEATRAIEAAKADPGHLERKALVRGQHRKADIRRQVRQSGGKVTEARASEIYDRRHDDERPLLSDLDFIQMGNGTWVQVADILDNPDLYDRRNIPDPAEGLAYGNSKATLLLRPRPGRAEEPRLVSHAHGHRRVWRFERHEPDLNAPPTVPGPDPTVPRDDAIAAHGRVIADWFDTAENYVRYFEDIRHVRSLDIDDASKANRVAEVVGQARLEDPPTTTNWPTRHSGAPRVLLSGAQGIGKTRSVIEAANELSPTQVLAIFEPDHVMSAQVARDLHDVVAVRGMLAPATASGGDSMCLRPRDAAALARHGMSVRSLLCRDCPLSDRCAYQAQAVAAQESRIIVAPHQYLWNELPGGVRPDMVVIDERPGDFGVEHHKVDDRIPLWPDAHPMLTLLVRHLRAMEVISVPALAAWGWTWQHLLQAKTEADAHMNVTAFEAADHFARDRQDGLIETALKDAVPGPSAALRALAGQVLAEFRIHDGRLQTVRRLKDGIAVAALRGAVQARTGRPLLVLDGTGDPALWRALLGPDLRHEHHPVERNAHVTQIHDRSFSKYSLRNDESLRAGLLDFMERRSTPWMPAEMLSPAENIAVMTAKGVLPALGLDADELTGHFSALKGRNRWEDCTEVMVIGREEPPVGQIRRIAAVFAIADQEPYIEGDYIGDVQHIRMRDGSTTPVVVRTLPDPWARRVLRQIRDREVEQALDRVRMIHNAVPKRVFLFNALALDVTVDIAVGWAQFMEHGTSRVEAAFRSHGFVPLSGRMAARLMPEIWTGKDTAARDLKGVERRGAVFSVRAPEVSRKVFQIVLPVQDAGVTEVRSLIERMTGDVIQITPVRKVK